MFFNEALYTLLGLLLFFSFLTKEIGKNKSMECFKKHVSLVFLIRKKALDLH